MTKTTPLWVRLRQRIREPDFWSACLVFLVSLIVYLPVSNWLFSATLERDRLLNALFVLGFAGALILLNRNRTDDEFPLKLTRLALYTLIASYLLLGVATISHSPHFVIFAFCTCVASAALFVFGNRAARLITALSIAFCAFIYLSVLMERLDWPLRMLAGKGSGWLLSLSGQDVVLGVVQPEAIPMLLLEVNGRLFHVAAECNGFGVIASALLLGILCGIYRRFRILELIPAIAGTAFLGFCFNVLRIIGIVVLAPHVGGAYQVMHEIVGLITFLSCLVVIWWLVGPRIEKTAVSGASV